MRTSVSRRYYKLITSRLNARFDSLQRVSKGIRKNMGVNGHMSKAWFSQLQRSDRKSRCAFSTVTVGNDSNTNVSANVPPRHGAIAERIQSRKARTGVYFQNREVYQPMHPLQVFQHCAPSSAICAGLYDVPIGKPLSPAPVLGHLNNMNKVMKPSGMIHFIPPVKVSKTMKHRIVHKPQCTALSDLSDDDELFVEAATSLSNARTPSLRQLETPAAKKKTTGGTTRGLPRPFQKR